MHRHFECSDAVDVAGIDHVKVLRKPDGGEVYLFGSCHMSRRSELQAAELVRRVRPSTVVGTISPMSPARR